MNKKSFYVYKEGKKAYGPMTLAETKKLAKKLGAGYKDGTNAGKPYAAAA